jgi:amino acid adenylation domain-containing protein
VQQVTERRTGSQLAIIGMACRFPGAASCEEFWRNLLDGRESLTWLSDADLARSGVPPQQAAAPQYVRRAAVLPDVESFDAEFFGYTPAEARLIDPQQRLFLECAWEAFEHAGRVPGRGKRRVGVFTGAKTNTYLLNLAANPDLLRSADVFQLALGNDLAMMATRVSFKLDLRGPCYALHTACSTSLVAVHLACQSLLLGECDLALAGGAAVNVPHRKGYLYQRGGILSSDGSSRTFDAQADGSNFGNGAGAVLLERLDDAEADGDAIYAVIRGSATNNDGAEKASYAAPGLSGQLDVLLEAMACAGVDAGAISYVEAHGTATRLGDSIEMLALTEAFRASTPKKGFCAIGSVKTNIGHLETAAGIAGLIKTTLALHHRQIPPSLHFERPNPEIDFDNSPFYVNTRLAEWPAAAGPRLAGVSSFGIGSTNAHVILEEAPAPAPASPGRPWQQLLLSARTETALAAATAELACHLRAHPELDLADVAYTLQVGRTHWRHRRAVVCRRDGGTAAAADALAASREAGELAAGDGQERPLVFLLPGLGDHAADMGLGLYQAEPVFRRQIDECAGLLVPHLGLDLRQVLYPHGVELRAGADPGGAAPDPRRLFGRQQGGAASTPAPLLDQTWLAQPALFVVEHALARLWMHWGARPQALLGYSLGELAAACLAGVMELPDALALVARRARLIEELPAGAMLAVSLSEAEATPLLAAHDTSLAAVNAAGICVAAGSTAAVAALEAELRRREVVCRRLTTSHPFHSPLLRPLAGPCAELLRDVELRPPQVPVLSNVTGDWLTPAAATDPAYWVRQMCEPVRFAAGLETLWRRWRRAVLLEVGPGQALTSLARLHPDCGEDAAAVMASIAEPFGGRSEPELLHTAVGRLWQAGVTIDWQAFHGAERRRRVALPTYPFERRRHWIEPSAETAESAAAAGGRAAPASDSRRDGGERGGRRAGEGTGGGPGEAPRLRVTLDKRPDPGSWLYVPAWRQRELAQGEPAPGQLARNEEAVAASATTASGRCWLLLGDGGGAGAALAARLRAAGHTVVRAAAGAAFETPVPAAAAAAADAGSGGAAVPDAGSGTVAAPDAESSKAAGGGEDLYRLPPDAAGSYQRLLAELAQRGRFPGAIVDLWNLGPAPGEADAAATPGATGAAGDADSPLPAPFARLLFLCQALGRQRLASPVHLAVLSNYMQLVTGDEILQPEKATLLGPCRVAPKELANLTCSSIDLAVPAAAVAADHALLDQLIEELTRGGLEARAVAYRGGRRWVEGFEPLAATAADSASTTDAASAASAPDAPDSATARDAPASATATDAAGLAAAASPVPPAAEAAPLRRQGVYLITGGLGGIGFTLAEELARTLSARLVLTGRTALPDRAEWQAWSEAHGDADAVADRIRKLRRLEELGAEVLAVPADAADAPAMAAVVRRAIERFGALHGVFHAAGVAGGGLMQRKSEAAAAAVLAPKVTGARALAAALEGVDLDFLVLFSSLATVMADVGQADYVAANAYLAAFAQQRELRLGRRTMAVEWDNWRDVGILTAGELPPHLQVFRQELLDQAIAPAEGIALLRRLLAQPRPRVLVSTQELSGRIELTRRLTADRLLAAAGLAPAAPGGSAGAAGLPGPAAGLPPAAELRRRVLGAWEKVLGRPGIGAQDNFFDLGGNSLLGMQLIADLNRDLSVQLSPPDLYESPTVDALVQRLAPAPLPPPAAGAVAARTGAAASAAVAAGAAAATETGREIAIVGMAGRFPGAAGVAELWRNLCAGVESIRAFSDQELAATGVPEELLRDPHYVKARSVLDGVELFDAALFGYTPREAEVMDPQHRLFLECAWEALEAAGYDPGSYDGRIGLFAGSSFSSYLQNLYSNPEVLRRTGEFQVMLGNEKDALPTRVSYKLNLRGPSLAVQTFCSTSLVAVHLACQSLLSGESTMALAGGVSIQLPQVSGYRYDEGSYLSGDGHVRTFDAAAQGIVFGNGLGIVVLKRLRDALADGDHVHAVIKGSAVNNDGSVKVGYVAPGAEGQVAVIAAALAAAGCGADTIGYVEAHGTGTPLGDPIEIAALTRVYRQATDRSGYCPIGSIKPNLGHLDRAAGISGLIKAALALEHRQIPPTLHFTTPNPAIDFASTPFYVNVALADWPQPSELPRRAAVSSLGVGGTNAHVILEQAPRRAGEDRAAPVPRRPWQLLVLTAQTPAALDAVSGRLLAHLERHPDLRLADVAYTLQTGRRRLPCRRVAVCRDVADAVEALARRDPRRLLTGAAPREEPAVVFMFPGLGGQYADMARGLYRDEAVFRAHADSCCELMAPHLGFDLRELLFPSAAAPDEPAAAAAPQIDLRRMLGRSGPPEAGGGTAAAGGRLLETSFSQPAVFAVEYALAQLWMSWGVRPAAMVGYSVGELTAACLAGVLSLADAAALVAQRACRIESLPPGAMLAVPLPEKEAAALLGEELSLAAVNGPEQSVLSGPVSAVAELETSLAARGIACRRLQATRAFHSAMMQPLAPALRELAAGCRLRPPEIPYLSNLTGTWITAAEATDPGYWARHMCGTVRFMEAVRELLADPARLLLEVGPGQTLSSLALQQGEQAGGDDLRHRVVASMRHSFDAQADSAVLLAALGRLWLAGARVDWRAFHAGAGERRRRLPLPTYPFERRRHWIEPGRRHLEAERYGLMPAATAAAAPPAPAAPAGVGIRLSAPTWQRALSPAGLSWEEQSRRGSSWLLLLDDAGLGDAIAARLEREGQQVVGVRAAPAGGRGGLEPRDGDYTALAAELADRDGVPANLVHLWSVAPPMPPAPAAADPSPPPSASRGGDLDDLETAQERGLWSVLRLARALAEHGAAAGRRLWIVASDVHAITGDEPLRPARATVLAAAELAVRLAPGLACHVVDVPGAGLGNGGAERRAEQVLAEIRAESPAAVVAYRGQHRWLPALEPLEPLDGAGGPGGPATTEVAGAGRFGGGAGEDVEPLWREGGVYLLMGELDRGAGPLLAGHLAREARARLALVRCGDAGETAARLPLPAAALEERAARTWTAAAGGDDAAAMRGVVEQVYRRFGLLHGVIYCAERHREGADGWDAAELCRGLRREADRLAALDEALDGRPLDFRLLVSTSPRAAPPPAAVTPGTVADAAASHLLDGLAAAGAAGAAAGARWGRWRFEGDEWDGEPAAEQDAAAPPAAVSAVLARLFALYDPARIEQLVVGPPPRAAARRGAGTDGGPAVAPPAPSPAAETVDQEAPLAAGPEAPRNAVERTIAGIWEDLLGLSRLSIHDNFLDVGGDSLLATRLIGKMRDAFGVELPLRMFFEGSTVAELAQAVGRALERAAAAGRQARPGHPVIPRLAAGARRPLSFTQERLWFLDQVNPGNPAYNVPAAVRLEGSLDAAALAASLAEIVRRHAVLRTSFVADSGEAMQVVAPRVVPALPVIDLSRLAGAARQAELGAASKAFIRAPFDLGRAPLLRMGLLRCGGSEHVGLLTIHHIVCDSWSIDTLVRELALLYECRVAGRPSPLPELALQFADFAAWQREELLRDGLAGHLAYWQRRLAGAPAALELPTDRPRPAVQSYWGGKSFFTLPPALVERLKALARGESSSLFMVLLAGLYALLHRHGGQRDMVVGTPVSNRPLPELEGLIGPFLNSLLLRLELRGDPTWRELLGEVRELTLAAFAHQELPFEKLLAELGPEGGGDSGRRDRRSPLFQVNFILQNAPRSELAVEGLTLAPLELDAGTVQLDLTLQLTEMAAGLRGWLEYDSDLFDRSTVRRLDRHFAALLGGDPDRRLSELPLLDPAELQQLLREWNDTAAPAPWDRRLDELFAEQAARRPGAPALLLDERTVSYGELARLAAGLAGELRRLGVPAGSLVGLCAERSLELVVAVLATLEAGCAYVPLDPSYPRERLELMLRDTAAPVVLAQPRHLDALPAGTALTLAIEPAGLAELAARGAAAATAPAETAARVAGGGGRGGGGDGSAGGDALAYVMYTSGSTGSPKGVAVTHANVVRLVRGADFAALGAEQVFLLLAPVSFDASTLELWGALANGGQLAIPPPGNPSLSELELAIERFGVTTLWLTAGLFHLVAEERPAALRPLRQLLAGGDVLAREAVRRVLSEVPELRLINGYGPTENTTFTCCHRIGWPSLAAPSVPIGRPIANTTAYVLDPALRPRPARVAGELYAGGAGVARGYHARPALTAERFVPDPFGGRAGGRLYRTGDLARWRPDGALEFLGRADRQVKVRGFRVELGEIEAALLRHPEVRQAAVLAAPGGGNRAGDRRLVAYVAGAAGAAAVPAPQALRDFLGATLPEHMVPQQLVWLGSLPLLPGGKVDRQALPPADGANAAAAAGAGFAAPRGPAEEMLAGLWAELLGREQVGVHDDLFALGAHSLMLTQAASRIRRLFGVELPLRSLFEAPSVAAQAASVERARAAAAGVTIPPVTPVPRGGPLPLSFTQERMWFLEQMSPGMSAYNAPGAVHFQGALDPAAVARGIRSIVLRHEIFRTLFPEIDGEPVQVIADSMPLPVPVVDLRALPQELRRGEALALARSDARRPFDLARGPLLRICLMRLGGEEHLLGMTIHHMTYDMWAREVFLRELGLLYDECAGGRPAALPPLPVQYADYAVWQRRWMTGPVLDHQLRYWREQLAPAPRVMELPYDRPRPPVQAFDGERLYASVPEPVARAVQRFSRGHGATVYMVLLAAFQALLSRYTGQPKVVVGTPIANRNRVEVENLLGFFANALVLYTDLGGDPPFPELVRRTRETALGAYAHQDLPFELLVQELHPHRDLSRPPLFQILFNFLQNYGVPTLAVGGLVLTVQEIHNGGAPYDLNWHLWETSSGFRGAADFNTGLFDRTTILRMLGHYHELLAGAVAHPERRVSELPLLGAGERHQLLAEWNDSAEPEAAATFPELFAARVAAAPGAVAVVHGRRRLTYRQLGRRAGRLARRLALAGIGRGDVVVLLAERGIPLLTAMLAVFELGAAYLPLDPRSPARRHLKILGQSGSSWLLTTGDLFERVAAAFEELPPPRRPRLLAIDETGRDAAAAADANGRRGLPGVSGTSAGAQDLAYVLFTSGSTGVPKGVMIEHRGMLNHLRAKVRELALTAADRIAQTAAQTFDISVWQFLAPLMAGGRVHVLGDEVVQDPPRLLDCLAEERITVLETVPSLLRVLLEEAERRPAGAARPPALRWLVATGEALPPELGRRWQACFPGVSLLNAYGPTECSDDVTHHRLAAGGEERRARVPIGRPLDNFRLYVLDAELRPLPSGVPGELHVAGAGVGRGYLREPRRTAEVFVPDPFTSLPGGRLYRTGDLARRLPDGCLDFLGRRDQQVKLRGFRIELGEIEATLAEHPAVAAAVVTAGQAAAGGEARLAAYVVARRQPAPGSEELRRFLGDRLPDYMLPTAFVTLDALPLGPSGKVDRGALPAPGAPELVAGAAYVPPRNPTEAALAGIWAELLGAQRVSAHDDFFHLGGHSLLAARVVSRVRESFRVELPLATFFEGSTLAELAHAVEVAQWAVRPQGFAAATAGTDGAAEAGLEVGEL